MAGRKERRQPQLLFTGSLGELLPDAHVPARLDRVLDLSWRHAAFAGVSCTANGRPGIDPEVAVRRTPAGFLFGFVHDRRLLREAQLNREPVPLVRRRIRPPGSRCGSRVG